MVSDESEDGESFPVFVGTSRKEFTAAACLKQFWLQSRKKVSEVPPVILDSSNLGAEGKSFSLPQSCF